MALNYHTVYPKTRTTRNLCKRVPATVPAGAPGSTSVNDGIEETFYEISVNWKGATRWHARLRGAKAESATMGRFA
jgi:hypothetical protein